MLYAWLASSLRRFYPATPPEDSRTGRLRAPRGQQVSFQAAFRTAAQPRSVTASVSAPASVSARVRRVGHVPLRHLTAEVAIGDLEGVGYLPGLVPDPLFDETTLEAGPWETNSFWITLRIDDELRPGEYEVRVTLSAPEEQSCELSLQLLVCSAIQPRRTGFPVTHWLHADALLDWYGLESFDSDFWRILGSYIWLSGTGREQMFDLVADPAECHDLSPQHADRVRHWRSRMIEVLRGREEGYVDHDELVPGRPARDVLSTPAPWKPL